MVTKHKSDRWYDLRSLFGAELFRPSSTDYRCGTSSRSCFECSRRFSEGMATSWICSANAPWHWRWGCGNWNSDPWGSQYSDAGSIWVTIWWPAAWLFWTRGRIYVLCSQNSRNVALVSRTGLSGRMEWLGWPICSRRMALCVFGSDGNGSDGFSKTQASSPGDSGRKLGFYVLSSWL